MNAIGNSRHKILYEHYLKIFHQKPNFTIQLKKEIRKRDELKPIITYIFCPTKEMPFWKLLYYWSK